ncbi:hypothetical protein J4476_05790 [Candidatus Woesearchaeota archaeon]|nr:MAG: hypothetical protein QT09_C0003G0011 [archaeon GW2011_AR18]MBS3162178.1 hypothetical protein [Candidatus Woesearchaeota archaeon]HIH26227.1 hypothetical protein [Nanoarchaeota archaeon]
MGIEENCDDENFESDILYRLFFRLSVFKEEMKLSRYETVFTKYNAQRLRELANECCTYKE